METLVPKMCTDNNDISKIEKWALEQLTQVDDSYKDFYSSMVEISKQFTGVYESRFSVNPYQCLAAALLAGNTQKYMAFQMGAG